MICKHFAHIGVGSTGEGIIRVLCDRLLAPRIDFINTQAHRTLDFVRTFSDAPSFTFVRNPFDWYISWYLVEMKYHRWRGGFEDWFYHRRSPLRMWAHWRYMTGQGCDYVGRFECYEEDLISIWEALIPNIVTREEVRVAYRQHCYLYPTRPWIEGIEQWLREDLYTDAMVEEIYHVDAPLFEQYGYSFEEHYFFPGGLPPSMHKNTEGISWSEAKKLSVCWAEWGPGRRGPFVRP